MNKKFDTCLNKQFSAKKVVVIGAGIIGINCALALQQQGYQVMLIDKQGVGEGCSKANAGHFATEQVFPLADPNLLVQLPKMLFDPLGPIALSPKHLIKAMPWFLQFFKNMLPSFREKNTSALTLLNKSAITCYLPLLKSANAEHLLTTKGSLLVFEKTSIKIIKKLYEQYKQAGVGVELLNRTAALALEPNLSTTIKYALFFTEVGHTINPWALSLALADYAKSLGVEYKKLTVESINQKASGVEIQTEQALVFAEHCVIATGAWSKNLINGLGYHLPIEAERGYSLTLATEQVEEAHQLLSRPVASAERKFIITPMENMLRLSGTVEYAGLNGKANYQRADMLRKNAEFILTNLPSEQLSTQEQDDGLINGVEKKWLGCRPSLPDSLPVICQAPKHDRIFMALGHQHLGLTQGAIKGKLISQLVSGQSTDIGTKPFCISRFN